MYIEYRDKIEEMVESGRYDFALDTLEGIYDWVFEHDDITEAQMQAVDNIEASVPDWER